MSQINDLHQVSNDQPTEVTPIRRTRSPQRSRAGKSLPTDRMKFDVQRRVLDAYARLSGTEKRVVGAELISQAINKAASHHTVGLSNSFFVDAGWLERRGRGEFTASDALITYRRRAGMNPDDPRAKEALAETLIHAWFWPTLENQLQFGGADEAELLSVLMVEADALPEHSPQLRNLLEWVEWVGLIRRDGDRFVPAALEEEIPIPVPGKDDAGLEGSDSSTSPTRDGRGTLTEKSPMQGATPPRRPSAPEVPPRAPSVLAFDFSFSLTAEDLAKLDPEQIQALFAAVGQVMSIRASASN